MNASHQRFRPCPDVRFRVIDREAVVLRQNAAQALVLNEVGARILQLLDGKITLADVIDTLSEEFEADRADIADDCYEFVESLTEHGIVEPVASDSNVSLVH